MKRLIILIFVILLVALIYTVVKETSYSAVPSIEETERFPGGETSVSYHPQPSFMLPAANLSRDVISLFHAGKALAHQPWVTAPTVTFDRDGVGPIFNARTCLNCHVAGGRGLMPASGKVLLNSGLVRLSLPGFDKELGVIPEPVYGDQLQTQSISLAHMFRHLKNDKLKHNVAPEAIVYIDWQPQSFQYPDGTVLTLRKPQPRLTELGYGELHPKTQMSLRNAPPLHGMGLLEMIPQSAINALVDEQDRDQNGVSGRLNYVWDPESKSTRPGRFGLKANRASVRLQTAAAFHGDVGISNPIFPEQPCTARQESCLKQINGNDKAGTEIPENQLTMVVNFTKNMGVPKRREPSNPIVLQGRTLFHQTGCAECHTPKFVTGKDAEFPHLSNQTIWPYTDLLLHDMGEGLADNRTDYLATGQEWRTPPLWGVGLSKRVNGAGNFLHDGRAQSIEEAIVWHGGEAQTSQQQFIELDKAKRAALIRFVESL